MRRPWTWLLSLMSVTVVTTFLLTLYQNQFKPGAHLLPCCSLSQRCQSEQLRLLIIVFSAMVNFDQRRAVRDTWGSWKYVNGTVALYFILGTSTNDTLNLLVQEEQETYRDLLLKDFLDTYENLTYKALAMLKSVSEDCPDVPHLLRTDDDTFVNVPNLLKAASNISLQKNAIFGYLMPHNKPHRNVKSKWYVAKWVYPDKYYPDFVSGTAYAMSGDVPAKLYAANPNTTYLYLEDVYVTGILAQKARVRRRDVKGFWNLQRRDTPCVYRDVISGHYVNETEMRRIWFNLTNGCL